MDESLPRKMKNFLLIVLLQMYPFSLKRSRCQISSGDNIILIMYYKYHVAIGFENICILKKKEKRKRRGESSPTVKKPGKHYLGQVIKVNTISNNSCG